MTFTQLLDRLQHDTLGVSLPAFRPELVLCVTIVLILLLRLPRWGNRLNAFWVALPGALLALAYTQRWGLVLENVFRSGLQPVFGPALAPIDVNIFDKLLGTELFTGLLIFDQLTLYFRAVLIGFLVLLLILTKLSGIPDREDSPDFYTLVIGGTLGMCLMASANHLLIVFLAVEMASVPSYALAGILKGRRQSSEAALKYAVYGAGAAGVMLYGISLLGGALGSVHMPTMAARLAMLSGPALAERQTVLMLGGLMMAVGLAFKLSAVPFHFWCPDVFEGASAEVNAFLSVASKAAALALLVRVVLGFGMVHEHNVPMAAAPNGVVSPAVAVAKPATVRLVAQETVQQPNEVRAQQMPSVAELNRGLAPARRYMAGLIALIAAITCTFGNLAAYGQTNIKRLLAYSTIAHAGYMMMPIAAAAVLMGTNPEQAEDALAAVAVYIGMYLFMNLGAFAVVAFVRNEYHTEEIADYAGLLRRSPGIVICFSIILISLLGLPPLAGFAAKFVAFQVLVPARLYALLVIGLLNTVVSLVYYLRLIKVMTMDPESERRLPGNLSLLSRGGVYVALITAPVVLLGVFWEPLYRLSRAAADHLLS